MGERRGGPARLPTPPRDLCRKPPGLLHLLPRGPCSLLQTETEGAPAGQISGRAGHDSGGGSARQHPRDTEDPRRDPAHARTGRGCLAAPTRGDAATRTPSTAMAATSDADGASEREKKGSGGLPGFTARAGDARIDERRKIADDFERQREKRSRQPSYIRNGETGACPSVRKGRVLLPCTHSAGTGSTGAAAQDRRWAATSSCQRVRALPLSVCGKPGRDEDFGDGMGSTQSRHARRSRRRGHLIGAAIAPARVRASTLSRPSLDRAAVRSPPLFLFPFFFQN